MASRCRIRAIAHKPLVIKAEGLQKIIFCLVLLSCWLPSPLVSCPLPKSPPLTPTSSQTRASSCNCFLHKCRFNLEQGDYDWNERPWDLVDGNWSPLWCFGHGLGYGGEAQVGSMHMTNNGSYKVIR
jgi:hypothetical protein